MDRRRLLFTVWNWLPGFQAVAEAEHLPTASARLRVTPSALSRTVTTLEDRLGLELFTRKGGALALNAHGRRLLAGMKSAHAALSASLTSLSSGELEGPLYACACGPLAQVLVAPVLRDLQQQSAKLVPYVYGYDLGEAMGLARSGQLDVVFASARVEATDLSSTFLGEAPNGVYCGQQHPLFSRDAKPDDVLQYPFVASCSPSDGKANDAFLPDVDRRIDLYVHQGCAVVELCLAGHLLAVLPDFVAEPHVARGSLRRLPFPRLPSTPLFAMCTGGETKQERVRLVIEHVGRRLAEIVARIPGQGADVAHPTAHAWAATTTDTDDAWLTVGHALLLHGEYAAAERAYESAYRERTKRKIASAADDARYGLAIANVLLRRGRYADAEAACGKAIRLAEPGIAAALEATVSLVRCYRGDFLRAREALERARGHAVAATARSDQHGARAWALVQRAEGNLLLETARVREAIAAYEAALATCEGLGDAWEHSIALFNLGDACAVAGDIERATRLLDEACRKKQELGDRWGLAHVHHVRARIAMGREDTSTALAELRAGLRIAIELGDPKITAALNNALGQAHGHGGEGEEAQRAFGFALRDAERCDARVEATRALLGLCDVQLQRGKAAAAKGLAERAHQLAREGAARPELAAALYALGEVASAQRRPADAASFYRSACEVQAPQLRRRATRPARRST